MIATVILSVTAIAGLAMLFVRPLRNAALFALSGTVMGYFAFHYPETVPEVQYIAILFWIAAAWLAAGHLFGNRRKGTA